MVSWSKYKRPQISILRAKRIRLAPLSELSLVFVSFGFWSWCCSTCPSLFGLLSLSVILRLHVYCTIHQVRWAWLRSLRVRVVALRQWRRCCRLLLVHLLSLFFASVFLWLDCSRHMIVFLDRWNICNIASHRWVGIAGRSCTVLLAFKLIIIFLTVSLFFPLLDERSIARMATRPFLDYHRGVVIWYDLLILDVLVVFPTDGSQ